MTEITDRQQTPSEILAWCATELVRAQDALPDGDRRVRARILLVALALDGLGRAAEARSTEPSDEGRQGQPTDPGASMSASASCAFGTAS
jgi:hypothetical protein